MQKCNKKGEKGKDHDLQMLDPLLLQAIGETLAREIS
jgi:hypothetical protein